MQQNLQHKRTSGARLRLGQLRKSLFDKYKPFIHNPLQTGQTGQISDFRTDKSAKQPFLNLTGVLPRAVLTETSGRRAKMERPFSGPSLPFTIRRWACQRNSTGTRVTLIEAAFKQSRARLRDPRRGPIDVRIPRKNLKLRGDIG